MVMSKYPISKEFFPFSHFTPPISERFLAMAVPNMKTPKFIHKDKEIDVIRYEVKSYDGENIEVFLMSPKILSNNSPCLVYLHGGGFVLAAAGYHYKNAMFYAKEVGCKVLFVNYRLAPKHPHPVFFEDCYAAFCWAYDNAKTLGIDNTRMGIGGDSAGSTLAVGVCMMARDRKHPVKFIFQMLPYPFLDARNNSESCKKYTDTPMWNSTLSDRIAPMTKVDKNRLDYVYYSPVEAEYNKFTDARKERMDKIMADHKVIAEEEKELDIFKGIINGISAKEAEKKYEDYKRVQQQALAGGR